MLEKIGLPAKPSMRGSAWVVDASHCQGCSNQFSFINRKHHCRRCGGIFCNSCTQQRMVLRGQGDSPVRTCDPCKKLEDAARFESRFGRQKRATKGGSKLEPNHDPTTEQNPQKSTSEANMASSSKETSEADTSERKEMEPESPEEMRQKAVEEKNKHKILIAEGKLDEARKAFKRGKELERQAQALEITLRKNRRKVLEKKGDIEAGVIDGKDATWRSSGPAKSDLLSELRDLGWDDGELNGSDQKRENLSLEGELSSMMKEIDPKSNEIKIDKTEVIALKKKALALKKEGKLAEAKEELKRAKVLERELEERELLAQCGDGSDDDLSALVRSLDDDKQEDPFMNYGEIPSKNLDFLSLLNDVPLDDHLEVDDDDMNDPEMAAALKSFGWSEEDAPEPLFASRESLEAEIKRLKIQALNQKRAGNKAEAMDLLRKAKQHEKDLEMADSGMSSVSHSKTQPSPTVEDARKDLDMAESEPSSVSISRTQQKPKPKSKFVLQRELLAVKKKALALRREGRADEAEEELNKGRDLERQLQEMEETLNAAPKAYDLKMISNGPVITEDDDVEAVSEVTDDDINDPAIASALKNLGWEKEVAPVKPSNKSTSRSKAEIQRELLAIKRKAMGLRREGKIQEADEELEKAKPLEEQIQAFEDQNIERVEPKVSESPRLPEEDIAPDKITSKSTERVNPPENLLSKAEIQRELLTIKRKALALKREGRTREADEELEKAKPLEERFQAMEDQDTKRVEPKVSENLRLSETDIAPDEVMPKSTERVNARENLLSKAEIQRELLTIKRKALALKREGRTREADEELEKAKPLEEQFQAMEDQDTKRVEPKVSENLRLPEIDISPDDVTSKSTGRVNAPENLRSKAEIQRELLTVKRKILALKREGRTQEADEELEKAKPLEERLQAMEDQNTERVEPKPLKEFEPETISKDFTSEEASLHNRSASFSPAKETQDNGASLEEMIKARKRKAVALKREGKLAEAREELRQAKLLEKSREEDKQSSPVDSGQTSGSTPSVSSRDRFKLQQEVLSHKRLALKLKREGKIQESEAEFELAKSLETQLEEITNGNDSKEYGQVPDDLLDPQLVSALKSIGWDDNEIHGKVNVSVPEKPKAKMVNPRADLEEQITAERRRALALKREGKQREALEALRLAKSLEKKLESL